jgi:hypothetical protein
MNAMPPRTHSDTFNVAQDTLVLSEKSGDRTLKLFGLALLAVSGLATVLHAGHAIYRDIFGAKAKGQRGRGEGSSPARPEQGATATGEAEPNDHDQRSWVHKARLTDRPEGEKRWAEHRGGHGRAGLH